MIKTPADLLKLLLSRHARGELAPPRLDALLLKSLRRNHVCDVFSEWPLEALLHNATGFFAFLQKRWTGYLAGQQPAGTLVQESGLSYDTGDLLPLDEPDVRAYVDTLFLEGKLKPVSPPEDWTIEGWAQVGVEFDEQQFELRRFTGLLEHLERELPDDAATHKDWMAFADRWAELTVLRYRLASNLSGCTRVPGLVWCRGRVFAWLTV